MSTSPSLVVNQSQLAAMLGVSPKTVQQWDRDALYRRAGPCKHRLASYLVRQLDRRVREALRVVVGGGGV